jgi:hypothetical protein
MDHNSKSTGEVVARVCTEIRAPKTETMMPEIYTVSADADGDIRILENGGASIGMSPAAARAIAKAILAMTSDAQAPAPVAAPAPIASAKPAPPPPTRAATRKFPWASMRVGDSFFADGKRITINETKATRGKRFASQADTVDGVAGFRVWRMS